jgi:divalent metal cation (Fe/Co/Zn/Cd) transporter
VTAPSAQHPGLRRTVRRLEWATIGWNAGEVFVTIGLGIASGSIALIAFGLDSLIEIFASGVVVWHERDGTESRPTARAHRLIGVAFLLLAASLAVAAVIRIVSGDVPRESPWGIAYTAVTAAVMFGLGFAKRRLAKRLGSTPVASEANMTILDGALASSVLLSLILTWAFGWALADPLAALVVAAGAVREARENLIEGNGA